MRYESIADIFSANREIRENLSEKLATITPAEATALPDGEKWSIQQIAEHVSMVGTGIARICGKLIADAKAGEAHSNGTFELSPEFRKGVASIADVKLEAPERVRPTGDVTVGEALERMQDDQAAYDAMREDLERLDLSRHTFPHPYLGEMSAVEWLVMAGLHERRHTKQLEMLAAKIRKQIKKVPG